MDSNKKQNIDLKKAYVLNMLTVSVSQIVDYNDINILEQEYDAIINNLNLENMPSDEELLTVFEQLLDTITFFRIQEKEKQFIEAEYQHRIKNAIWAAAPQFVAIFTGNGLNLVKTLEQLAFYAGITYMNYRRNKAEYQLERDKRYWELQRTALEQFNSLRRRLFDAAWRLSEDYPDECRLTESQIHQYNMILLDSNLIRRYERLDYIKDAFIAYPPFWYYLGSAALEASINSEELSDKKRKELKEEAKAAFDKFNSFKMNDILRTDPITAQCEFEYISLLDGDKEQIKGKLDLAAKMSGDACDVLQICAVEYLAIQDEDSAIKYLKYLISEGFNKETNAQMLSQIYAKRVVDLQRSLCSRNEQQNSNDHSIGQIKEELEKVKGDYSILVALCGYGYQEYLFPLPQDNDEDLNSEMYIEKRREILFQKYSLVVRNYIASYGVQFNKAIPCLSKKVNDEREYYSATSTAISERLELALETSKRPMKWKSFVKELAERDFLDEYISVLNNMYEAVEGFNFLNQEQCDTLFEDISSMFIKEEVRQDLIAIQNKLDGIDETEPFVFEDYKKLSNRSFNYFIEQFARDLVDFGAEYIDKIDNNNIELINDMENELFRFCTLQGLDTAILSPEVQPEYDYTSDGSFRRLSLSLLGDTMQKQAAIKAKKGEMKTKVEEALSNGIIKKQDNPNDIQVKMLLEGTSEFAEYLRKNNFKGYIAKDIVAVIDDTAFSNKDIIFMKDGVCIKTSLTKTPVSYDKFSFENGGIKYGRFANYDNKQVDLSILSNLIEELGKISEEISKLQKEEVKDNDVPEVLNIDGTEVGAEEKIKEDPKKKKEKRIPGFGKKGTDN